MQLKHRWAFGCRFKLSRDEIRNVVTVYVNQQLTTQRRFDAGRQPTANAPSCETNCLPRSALAKIFPLKPRISAIFRQNSSALPFVRSPFKSWKNRPPTESVTNSKRYPEAKNHRNLPFPLTEPILARFGLHGNRAEWDDLRH